MPWCWRRAARRSSRAEHGLRRSRPRERTAQPAALRPDGRRDRARRPAGLHPADHARRTRCAPHSPVERHAHLGGEQGRARLLDAVLLRAQDPRASRRRGRHGTGLVRRRLRGGGPCHVPELRRRSRPRGERLSRLRNLAPGARGFPSLPRRRHRGPPDHEQVRLEGGRSDHPAQHGLACQSRRAHRRRDPERALSGAVAQLGVPGADPEGARPEPRDRGDRVGQGDGCEGGQLRDAPHPGADAEQRGGDLHPDGEELLLGVLRLAGGLRHDPDDRDRAGVALHRLHRRQHRLHGRAGTRRRDRRAEGHRLPSQRHLLDAGGRDRRPVRAGRCGRRRAVRGPHGGAALRGGGIGSAGAARRFRRAREASRCRACFSPS